MKKIINIVMMVSLAMIATVSARADSDKTENGEYTVQANWSTLKRGNSPFALTVFDANNQEVSQAKITIAYDMVGMSMNPPAPAIADKGNGIYDMSFFIGMRGTWQFNITIQKNGNTDTLVKQTAVNN